MTDIGAGEAHEHFATDLDLERLRAGGIEGVVGEAIVAFDNAQSFLNKALSAAGDADMDLRHLEDTAISAIETAGFGSDPREVLEAIMAAKGKSDEEIESYFNHIDRINAEDQPVIVIAGSDEDLSIAGLIGVTYGMTASDDLRRYGQYIDTFGVPEKTKSSFDAENVRPGSRHMTILAKSRRGFSVTPDFASGLFAQTERDDSFDAVLTNINHPFDRVHFAGSADEVDETIDKSIGTRIRSRPDNDALNALGVPTMVAYGEDAVLQLSERISKTGARGKILARRCIEGLGIDTSAIEPNLSEYKIISSFGNDLFRGFDDALGAFLEVGHPDVSAMLAFLGPLQPAIGYHPGTVLDKIKGTIFAMYSPREGRVVTEDSTSEKAVEEELARSIKRLHDLGITAQGNDGPTVSELASGIRGSVIRRELRSTPKRRFIKRRGLDRALANNDSGY